jgi:hypothetical protein
MRRRFKIRDKPIISTTVTAPLFQPEVTVAALFFLRREVLFMPKIFSKTTQELLRNDFETVFSSLLSDGEERCV